MFLFTRVAKKALADVPVLNAMAAGADAVANAPYTAANVAMNGARFASVALDTRTYPKADMRGGVYICAYLSQWVYTPRAQRSRVSTKTINDGNQDLTLTQIWLPRDEKSMAVVCVNEYGQHVVYVTFKGMHLGMHGGVDLGRAMNLLSQDLECTARMQDCRANVEHCIRKYGRDNVVCCGHSLGGALASQVAQQYGVPAKIFNPGCGEALAGHMRRYPDRVEAFHIVGDYLSAASDTWWRTRKYRKHGSSKGAHDMSNFTWRDF
jgi:hypothetical protein